MIPIRLHGQVFNSVNVLNRNGCNFLEELQEELVVKHRDTPSADLQEWVHKYEGRSSFGRGVCEFIHPGRSIEIDAYKAVLDERSSEVRNATEGYE